MKRRKLEVEEQELVDWLKELHYENKILKKLNNEVMNVVYDKELWMSEKIDKLKEIFDQLHKIQSNIS